jgi:hypothetical protein
MASMFTVVRSKCSLGLLSAPPTGPHFHARCICCRKRWKLLVRTCRACCLICGTGDDDVDAPGSPGDGGADADLGFESSIPGDPAVEFPSSMPLARCPGGEALSRNSETEDDSSAPSIAGCPDAPDAEGDS